MQKTILILLMALICLSCQKDTESTSENTAIEFDKEKWATKVARVYPYRPDMLDELLYSEKIRKLKLNEILDMLGPPDRIDEYFLFYMIEQKKIGFFTLHQKTLVFKFEPDSTVSWIKLHE